MKQDEDLSFLSFFLNEAVYLIPEPEPVYEEQAEQPEAVMPEAPEDPPVPEGKEETPQPLSAPEPLTPPDFQGLNHQEVLVLFHNSDTEQMPAEDYALLQKILSAVKYAMEDIALCNWAILERQQEQRKDIFESLQLVQSQKIVVFGALPLAWSLSHFFKKYDISREGSGKHLLQADDLSKIAQNRELKVKLWDSLQRLFT